jgi:hypothetical protein
VEILGSKKFDLDTTKIQDKIDSKIHSILESKSSGFVDTPVKTKMKNDAKSPKISEGKQKHEVISVPDRSEEVKKKKKFAPPFDPFGITPEFYIKGKSQTKSWVGCFCSVIQIILTILVVYFYSRSFI